MERDIFSPEGGNSLENKFFYCVTATLPNLDAVKAYKGWLIPHISKVINAGALSGKIVELNGGPLRVESHYIFESRKDFENYEMNEAPKLRQEGIIFSEKYKGISYERKSGEIIYSE